MSDATVELDWGWAEKCRLIGGHPTLELFETALQAGSGAVPLMVDILSRASFREGEPPEYAHLPIHAARIVGALRAAAAVPALLGVVTDPRDGTYAEEAAIALGRIGAPALPPLERLVDDRDRDTWVRTTAVQALTFAALADRRLRPRVLAAFERRLTDPLESDHRLIGHLVTECCSLGAESLLPAIASAHAAGRLDEDVIEYAAAELDLITRRHRPDREAKTLVRRDVREDYVTWAEMSENVDERERRRYENEFARIDRDGASPPH